DDAAQGKKAATLIQDSAKRTEELFVNNVVLCELVWVLQAAYDFSKTEIADVLEKILMTELIIVQNQDEAWLALSDYRTGAADYSDYFIGRINKSFDCEYTVTFDQATGSSDLFHKI
ncbi:MAG TPA: PIN domain nuclease, partial [Acidobacteriota bacterium]